MEQVLQDAAKTNRYLRLYLDNCVRCGACIEACHFYQGDKSNPLHAPVYKNELIRRLYKKKSLLGKLGYFGRSKSDPEETIKDISYAVYETCTNCRRCVMVCPMSIDISVINTAARTALIGLEKAPEMLLTLADMQLMRRASPESYVESFKEQLAEYEKEIREEFRDPSFNIPIVEGDKKAKVLYVPLSGAHTIIPAAKIFHAAKEDWVMSLFDSSNYGFLAGDAKRAKEITEPIVEEAKRVGAEKVVISECGHALRVMNQFAELWFNGLPFEVELISDTISGYIRDNRIQLDKSKNPGRFTHHDPCQHARNAGVFESPRHVLEHTVEEFVEMTPNGPKNWCCGGGGGIVAVPEFDEARKIGGAMKLKQIKETGASVVTTTCDNCKLQIGALIEENSLSARIEGIADVTARALVV